MSPELIALHLGALHPVEKVLTLGLAFGPFLVLFAVIALRRREEPEGEEQEAADQVRAHDGAHHLASS
jgi:hypothetical protein